MCVLRITTCGCGLPVCSQEDWGQLSAQSEEVSITEEDLELIKERETNIRQLEVGSSAGSPLTPAPAQRGSEGQHLQTCLFAQMCLFAV